MAYDFEKNMTNHAPKDSVVAGWFESIRVEFKTVAVVVDALCPESREKSLAFTNLEQALMWAIASIARNQGV